jgi:hypothetical protein
MVTQQVPHGLLIKAFAAAFFRPQEERDLSPDSLLQDGGFAPQQVIEMFLVARVDFSAPAELRKWPSLNRSVVQWSSRGLGMPGVVLLNTG